MSGSRSDKYRRDVLCESWTLITGVPHMELSERDFGPVGAIDPTVRLPDSGAIRGDLRIHVGESSHAPGVRSGGQPGRRRTRRAIATPGPGYEAPRGAGIHRRTLEWARQTWGYIAMSIFEKLWPGRPEPTPRERVNSTVTDSDIDTVVSATSYVLKGEAVPPDVMTDVRRIKNRKTGFFLGDAMTIPDQNGGTR
jgi:hypothetical protein